MSQKELGMMLGLAFTTICNYEKHDKAWKNKRSIVPHKLIDFLNGKYDSENVVERVEKETVEENGNTPVVKLDAEHSNITVKSELESEPAESTLNVVIDILQEKVIHKVAAGEDAGVYVGMIAGVCDGYLKCKKED